MIFLCVAAGTDVGRWMTIIIQISQQPTPGVLNNSCCLVNALASSPLTVIARKGFKFLSIDMSPVCLLPSVYFMHMTGPPMPPPSIFAYCKLSKTGVGEDLGMRALIYYSNSTQVWNAYINHMRNTRKVFSIKLLY